MDPLTCCPCRREGELLWQDSNPDVGSMKGASCHGPLTGWRTQDSFPFQKDSEIDKLPTCNSQARLDFRQLDGICSE